MTAPARKLRKILHVLAKITAFFWFGLGSLFYAGFVLPVIQIFYRQGKKSSRIMRRVIKAVCRFFTNLLMLLRLISLEIKQGERLEAARGMVVCANHPTLIDIVILLGLIPQADCIVKAGLFKNFFTRGVVRRLYISNSLDADRLLIKARRSLEEGNNLIIFPEGTRSGRKAQIPLHRSAAQIAIRTNLCILPVRINVDSPNGLRKRDSIFAAPKSGVVRFLLDPKPLLNPDRYSCLETAKAARLLTNELKAVIINDLS